MCHHCVGYVEAAVARSKGGGGATLGRQQAGQGGGDEGNVGGGGGRHLHQAPKQVEHRPGLPLEQPAHTSIVSKGAIEKNNFASPPGRGAGGTNRTMPPSTLEGASRRWLAAVVGTLVVTRHSVLTQPRSNCDSTGLSPLVATADSLSAACTSRWHSWTIISRPNDNPSRSSVGHGGMSWVVVRP